MSTPPQELTALLQEYQQAHLTRDWNELDETQRAQLVRQIRQISFPRLQTLIDQARDAQQAQGDQAAAEIQPLDRVIRLPDSEAERARWQAAETRGRELLDAGRVGAILVAGGQGSRLGFPHPKGMFPVGPVTDRTLFQIFFEQLLALSNRHGTRIPYFIMTSEATHDETEQFLQEHAWFGYPAEDVFLFQQGTLPAVETASGRILLADKGSIAMSPDGHGGLLRALREAGLIDEMQRRGLTQLFYHQVDNPGVKLCDPAMLGFHVEQEAEISTKVVAKREPEEKVGVLARVAGKQAIIEYSDLPQTLAEQREESGGLAYWAGNIAIHVFNLELLDRLTATETGLPIHIANKKVPFTDDAGQLQQPESPNAWKFEQFIFDAIPLARNPLVIETDRAEEFYPVKNAQGSDSPETTREALLETGRRWLEQAGYSPPPGLRVEISPLVALTPADLTGLLEAQSLTADELVLIPEEA